MGLATDSYYKSANVYPALAITKTRSGVSYSHANLLRFLSTLVGAEAGGTEFRLIYFRPINLRAKRN